MKKKNNRYSYYVSYVYQHEKYEMSNLTSRIENVFGNVAFNTDKSSINNFTNEDYNWLTTAIADSINNQFKEALKNSKYKTDDFAKSILNEEKKLVNKENIIIINILPKKWEEIENEETKN